MKRPAYHRPQSHPRAVRAKQRTALCDCCPRSIFRRVLSRLRDVLRATAGTEFDATARATDQLGEHRRRFHRNACAPPLVTPELLERLKEIRLLRLAAWPA